MVERASLRIVFFGTPDFAVPTLSALLRSRHDVIAVVSQPDRARDRHGRTVPTPVKRAVTADVPVLQPERLKEPPFHDAIRALQPDLGVVAAYGKILPEWLLALPRLGMVNVHASLLPRYRGAAPIQRAVMAGEPATGVTIMRIVKELDAGPMLARVVRPIAADATSGDVARDLAAAGGELLVHVVDALAEGRATEEPQDHATATYAAKITPGDTEIDWRRPAREIHDQVRGLNPAPCAWTRVDGVRVLVLRTAVEDPTRALPETRQAGGAPGEVQYAKGEALLVATGHGLLRVLELKPEARRAMEVRDFLAGHPLPRGTRLR